VLASTGLRLFFSVVVVLLSACLAEKSLAAESFPVQERQQASLAVTRTVLGILGFVRWPEPHNPLNLCVTGEVQFAEALLSGKLRQSNGQLLNVQYHAQADRLPLDCNVLYLGKLSAALQQALFERFFDRPALLISEADEECASGNMFCLLVANRQVSFRINLDSLARSQAHVHPNVLRLARGKR